MAKKKVSKKKVVKEVVGSTKELQKKSKLNAIEKKKFWEALGGTREDNE